MRVLWFVLMLAVSGLSLAGDDTGQKSGPMVIFKSAEPFEDVIENIKMAIEERGMLVSGTLHVSDMLNRTGADLGYRQVFERAESVEFCSASISHRMTQVAPQNMAICPFTISVYIRSDEPDQLYVAYRRQQLAGDAAAVTATIDELLNGIVEDSIE
ncbi:MAG: DUF302 domain-containing protein [Pseudomonadota bacterium]